MDFHTQSFSKLVGNKICKDPIIWLEQSFSFKKK